MSGPPAAHPEFVDNLDGLRARAAGGSPEDDPKLDLLVEELARIAAEAEREAIGEQDHRNRRKVIIFSYFADTVEWIAEHLESVLQTDRRLAHYRGRMTVVRGTIRTLELLGATRCSASCPSLPTRLPASPRTVSTSW